MNVKTYFEFDDSCHRLHTYFKGSPFDKSGKFILYVRFKNLDIPGQICLMDRATQDEHVIGESTFLNYHSGANQNFCDRGRKVIYQKTQHSVVVYDIETKDSVKIPLLGILCNYSGRLDQVFIERDENFPLDRQHKMGIYANTIDGQQRYQIANVEKLLSVHPRPDNILASEILLRVGGEISPDQKKIILFLVSRNGTLVRDYFISDMKGEHIEFVGRLGCHIMWCPNNKDIVSAVSPWTTDLGSLSGFALTRESEGLLCRYDSSAGNLEILSGHPIDGGSHSSPSPDGNYIVIDSGGSDRQSIYCFDLTSGEMNKLYGFDKYPVRNDPKTPGIVIKSHPHPAFSHDSNFILFNKCTDGVIRLCEIEL